MEIRSNLSKVSSEEKQLWFLLVYFAQCPFLPLSFKYYQSTVSVYIFSLKLYQKIWSF